MAREETRGKCRTCRIALPLEVKDEVVRRTNPSPCPSRVAASLHFATVLDPSLKHASISDIAAHRNTKGLVKFCGEEKRFPSGAAKQEDRARRINGGVRPRLQCRNGYVKRHLLCQ